MKKIILSLAIMLISIFTFSSCVTTAYADDDTYGHSYDYNVIITNGTPFIVNGLIAYYLYNNMYFYPYYRNGIYHFCRYEKQLPHDRMPRFYKPMPPRNNMHMYNNREFNLNRQQRPSQNDRSFGNMPQKPRMNNMQQNNSNRTFGNGSVNHGNRPSINNNGHFGGRR